MSKYLSRRHNVIYGSDDSQYTFSKSADIRDSFVKMNGRSRLVVEDNASIRNVHFYLGNNTTVHIRNKARLENLSIIANNHSSLSISEETCVSGVDFLLDKGLVSVSEHNIISNGKKVDHPCICVEDGTLKIGRRNVIKSSFWIRFGGIVSISDYNCINEGTEIRCDESIMIGSYNMISYSCDIWDTNTHEFLSLQEKECIFPKDFPVIGRVHEKPATKPITISDGSWIGKYACILKGSFIENDVILGIHAIVSNERIKTGARVIPQKSRVLDE